MHVSDPKEANLGTMGVTSLITKLLANFAVYLYFQNSQLRLNLF